MLSYKFLSTRIRLLSPSTSALQPPLIRPSRSTCAPSWLSSVPQICFNRLNLKKLLITIDRKDVMLTMNFNSMRQDQLYHDYHDQSRTNFHGPWFESTRRWMTIDAKPSPQPLDSSSMSPKRISRFGKKSFFFLAAALIGFSFWMVDLWINDDFDSSLWDFFRTHLPPSEQVDRPKIVILGSGWGGLSVLRKLHTDKFDVTLISPRNYFLFTPLLASTTSGLVELRSIVEPIRSFCNRHHLDQVKYIQMEASEIDPIEQSVRCKNISSLSNQCNEINVPYDYLIVAVGGEPATFNVPGVKDYTNFMKSIGHSHQIRRRIIDCFETAMIPGQAQDEIDRLLHFIVVGGGPSGVEYTGELYDFVKKDLKRNFPHVVDRVRITLIEALPKILPMFDATLINYVENKFTETRKINVWTRSAVKRVGEEVIHVQKQDTNEQITIPYGLLVWVTGNTPCQVVLDLIKKLKPENQPIQRGLSVDPYLRVKGSKNIFSIGDCALASMLPATAQVASQEGHYLARLLNANAELLYEEKKANKPKSASDLSSSNTATKYPLLSEDRSALDMVLDESKSFKFKAFGSLAYIGQHEAIVDFGTQGPKMAGFSIWMLWRSVYISKLLSVRNRYLVLTDWLKATIFGRDISKW